MKNKAKKYSYFLIASVISFSSCSSQDDSNTVAVPVSNCVNDFIDGPILKLRMSLEEVYDLYPSMTINGVDEYSEIVEYIIETASSNSEVLKRPIKYSFAFTKDILYSYSVSFLSNNKGVDSIIEGCSFEFYQHPQNSKVCYYEDFQFNQKILLTILEKDVYLGRNLLSVDITVEIL